MSVNMDFLFNYQTTLRFLLVNKSKPLNSIENIPGIRSIVPSFSVIGLEDLNDAQIFNYFYFCKFFFGCRAFLVNFKTRFSYGKTTFNLKIQVIRHGRKVYTTAYFFLNDVLPMLGRDFLTFLIHKNLYNIAFFIVKDLNIFVEKKTNLGLFSLVNPLRLKFICSSVSITLLLRNFKMLF